ncbi:DUF3558 domain-containing protein [Pseudonocardia abyssalis]|uniref:DUF3558 domain-containing protein n=1 Tax=Pseudonocardia abyssalis TaxID=2792008 RepID=A0ABS6UMJ7_9PSEU|nr:DUF3558 domain-containing protein [Pseudonocardia abyssalis]MBW0118452.1 DUF3558 domain-containing protein [Pseudonocardia abyssalis]MBW0133470.1 DUF3558 domain-containing protein [Pseudonocardia abyssalis]
MRRVAAVLVGMLVCGAMAGCVRETVGAGAAPVPESAATDVPLPPRPRDIDIRGLDPCALLTEEQRAELGLDGEPTYDVQRSPLFDGPEPACTISGYEPALAVGVALPYDGLGVDAFAPARVRGTVTVLVVQGFPAVQADPVGALRSCTVVVDLGPGTALNVQYRDGSGQPPIPTEDLCPGARAAADSAMRTLLSLS